MAFRPSEDNEQWIIGKMSTPFHSTTAFRSTIMIIKKIECADWFQTPFLILQYNGNCVGILWIVYRMVKDVRWYWHTSNTLMCYTTDHRDINRYHAIYFTLCVSTMMLCHLGLVYFKQFKLLLLNSVYLGATIDIFIFNCFTMNDDKDVNTTICECGKHKKHISNYNWLLHIAKKKRKKNLVII